MVVVITQPEYLIMFITQPEDLIIEQLSHLAIPDLFRVERVNKRLNRILNRKKFWLKKIRDFGDIPDEFVRPNNGDPRDYYLNVLHYPGHIYHHMLYRKPVLLRRHCYIPRKDLIEETIRLLDESGHSPNNGCSQTILYNIDETPTSFRDDLLFECSGYATRNDSNDFDTDCLTHSDAAYVTQIDVIIHIAKSYTYLTKIVSDNHVVYKTEYYRQFLPRIISKTNKKIAGIMAAPKIFRSKDQGDVVMSRRKRALIKWIREQIHENVPPDSTQDIQIQQGYGFENYKQMQQFQSDYIRALTEMQIATMETLYQTIKSKILLVDNRIVTGLMIDINEKIIMFKLNV